MNKDKIQRQAKTAGLVFKMGFMAQIQEHGTIGIATTVGIWQGMKYKGSFKNGIIAGVGTLIILGSVNGTLTLVRNKDVVKAGLDIESL